MNAKKKILLVDDEIDILDFLFVQFNSIRIRGKNSHQWRKGGRSCASIHARPHPVGHDDARNGWRRNM